MGTAALLGMTMLLTTPGAALASTAPVDLYAPTALYTMYKLLSTYDTNETKTDKYRHAYISNDTTEELTKGAKLGGYVTVLSDSGCDCNIFLDRNCFSTYRKLRARRDMDQIRQQGKSRSIGIGTVHLQVNTDNGPKQITLHDCLHSPDYALDIVGESCLRG